MSSVPDNHGYPALISDTDANDSDKSFTIPTNTRWLIQSIFIKFAADVNAGNRQITVLLTTSADVTIGMYKAGAVQAASTTYYYNFFPGAAWNTTIVATTFQIPIPMIILPAGYKIRVYDSAAISAAGDDMDIHIVADEWIEE